MSAKKIAFVHHKGGTGKTTSCLNIAGWLTKMNRTVLAIMKDVLESEGYAVLTAVDGQEALEKVKKETPDLIVLDLMLPKFDGYKVCAMLKFDKNYTNIPVIILTARASEEDKKMGEEARADAYLTKPFQPDVLLSKIKELLTT